MGFLRWKDIPEGHTLASFRQMMKSGTFGVGKDGIEQEDAQKTTASVTDTPVEVTG
jgi:hypothetical protein